jgi:hypothetical protein
VSFVPPCSIVKRRLRVNGMGSSTCQRYALTRPVSESLIVAPWYGAEYGPVSKYHPEEK